MGKLYPWGTDEIDPSFANYYDSKKGGTTSVGSYKANGYGLYDMAGNVWEWTWDWRGNYAQTAQTDPRGPISGSGRVIRGGSWGNGAVFSRVALSISNGGPDFKDYSGGFRSVLPPGQP